MNGTNFKLLCDLVSVLKDVWSEAPDSIKTRFSLERVSKKALLDGNEVPLQMIIGVFEGRTFFAYDARLLIRRFLTDNFELRYASVGVGNSVFLFAKQDHWGSLVKSDLTVETTDKNDLTYLVRLHSQLRGQLNEHRRREQEDIEKSERQTRLLERSALPTIETPIERPPANVDKDELPLLHPIKSAALTICIVVGFPWFLLICLVAMGFDKTVALVGALLRDFEQNVKNIASVIFVLAVLIAIAFFG